MADVKRGGPRPSPAAPSAREPVVKPTSDRAPAQWRGGWSTLQPGRQDERHSGAESELLGEGRIGADDVTAAELRRMGSMVAARHLMTLLAKRHADRARADTVREVAALLLGLEDGPYARRLLIQMAEHGRIVDIYPLEIMTYLVENHPDALDRVTMGPIVLNKSDVEARTYQVEEVIELKIPLSLRMRSFALEGGGCPGYCLSPGPPARYHLEVAEAGRFTLLLRGEVRRKSLIDRVCVTVVDPPDSD